MQRKHRYPVLAVSLALAGCAGQLDPAADANSADIQRSPSVQLAAHHDVSPPLILIPPAERSGQLIDHPVKRLPRPAASVSSGDSVHQAILPSLFMPTTAANFDGIGNGFGGFSVASAPPDTNGDIGPNHYVQTVNSDFVVLGRSGAILHGPVPINTLWSGFGGLCQTDNDGDPVVKHDNIADRWIITQFAVTGADGGATPFLQCVAVSTTADPTGSYARYSFPYNGFNDYPKLSVWPDAYYITFNIFNAGGTAFLGGKVCAYDRARMLTGAAATQQCFDVGTTYGGLLPSDLDGAAAPPAGSPAYVLALGATTSTLALWKFHVSWTTPGSSTLTGPTEFSVSPYSPACNSAASPCIPQVGTTQQLDSLSDRLMYRLAYRNFGNHEALVVNHSVTVASQTGVRWYEIRSPGGTPTVFQQGTYAPDSNHRWMGSIAMDRSGNMALGFSLSSASLHPQIHYTGRLVGDAAGTMSQGEGTIINGGGSQGASLNRWGDYSNLAIDPLDDCTFWFTSEYLATNGTFNWNTRIGSFKFPGCGGTVSNDFSITASPASLSLASGASGTSTIATAVTSGSAGAVSLSVSGAPSGATASLSPTSVTAGGSATLTVNAGTAAAGSYTLTVTGVEGSATHSTTVTVNIGGAVSNDFSIAASPSSLTLVQGTAGTSTISTAVTAGSAAPVSLAVSGAPAGATAALSPSSVTAGSSSTLTVNAGTAAPGSYTLTVTGTEGAATHSATVALTVSSGGTGGGIVNGNFETGTLSGWSSTGTTAVVAGGAHSGTYSARVGGTSPTSGDSSIAQTFSAPSTGGQLSFWYNVNCPDTLTYDWATATLKDNTTGATTTVLPQVCNATGTWAQVTASLAAGHSYTLMLISHDDNYSTDPTYTGFDDVTIGAAAPPSPIVNGGFESGSFTGWTTTGIAAISSTAHAGTHSARLGSTVPTSGDSTAAQTFTAPAGSSKLTLWYQVHCPDTLTYDWATATLKDNTTNTTATVFAKVCSNSGSWTQAAAGVTAGHSYTIKLVSHDDNYSSDPTYTYFDDVAVQ